MPITNFAFPYVPLPGAVLPAPGERPQGSVSFEPPVIQQAVRGDWNQTLDDMETLLRDDHEARNRVLATLDEASAKAKSSQCVKQVIGTTLAASTLVGAPTLFAGVVFGAGPAAGLQATLSTAGACPAYCNVLVAPAIAGTAGFSSCTAALKDTSPASDWSVIRARAEVCDAVPEDQEMSRMDGRADREELRAKVVNHLELAANEHASTSVDYACGTAVSAVGSVVACGVTACVAASSPVNWPTFVAVAGSGFALTQVNAVMHNRFSEAAQGLRNLAVALQSPANPSQVGEAVEGSAASQTATANEATEPNARAA